MRLYAVTLSAVHDRGGEKPEITMLNSVALLHDDQDVEAESLALACERFPEAEGWTDYQVVYTEIETGIVFADRYRLTWSVEDGQVEAHRPEGPADQREGSAPNDR